jgi:hypothetical protein
MDVNGGRQRCLEAGANGYLSKPIETAELLAAIAPWLLPVKAALASLPPSSPCSPGMAALSASTTAMAAVAGLSVDATALEGLSLKTVLAPARLLHGRSRLRAGRAASYPGPGVCGDLWMSAWR